MVDSVYITVVK